MKRNTITKIQEILDSQNFSNSYAKVSTRQLNIFKTKNERKKYINYLMTYAIEHSNLSFIQGIEYKNQKTFSYNLNKGVINIPEHLIMESNFVNYIPLILSLIEFQNVYYPHKKSTDEKLFNQILFNYIKKLFKKEADFLQERADFNLEDIHIDYIEKNAIEALVEKSKEQPIKIDVPNLNFIYLCKNFFMFQNKGIFVIKNNICIDL